MLTNNFLVEAYPLLDLSGLATLSEQSELLGREGAEQATKSRAI